MTFTVKLLLLAALIACLVLITASTFLTPVSNDAGAYLTIADGWLAGKLPYRDLFDHKTPGIYALYALILALSGRSLVAVQLIQLAGQIAVLGGPGRSIRTSAPPARGWSSLSATGWG